jgi:hypothetical protein
MKCSPWKRVPRRESLLCHFHSTIDRARREAIALLLNYLRADCMASLARHRFKTELSSLRKAIVRPPREVSPIRLAVSLRSKLGLSRENRRVDDSFGPSHSNAAQSNDCWRALPCHANRTLFSRPRVSIAPKNQQEICPSLVILE